MRRLRLVLDLSKSKKADSVHDYEHPKALRDDKECRVIDFIYQNRGVIAWLAGKKRIEDVEDPRDFVLVQILNEEDIAMEKMGDDLSVELPKPDQLLSSKQAAEMIGINQRHMRHLAKTGRIPSHKIGKRWCFSMSDLETYTHPGKEKTGGFLSKDFRALERKEGVQKVLEEAARAIANI